MTKPRNTRAAITASAVLAKPSTETVVGSGGQDAGSVGTASDPASTPPSGDDTGGTPAATGAAAPTILDAELPSSAAAGGSLIAPVVPAAGAVLGGVVSGELWKETGVDTGAGDIHADVIEGLELGGRIIMVRSVSDRGRRRAGIAFGPVPQPVEVDDLTEDQLGGLLADPQLIVSLDD